MELIRAAALDTSPPAYLVADMLPDMGCGFAYGDSYTGKTLAVAIELCLAVANGVPYFGHDTEQGAAVWALGEGLPDAGVRIKARLVREQHDRRQRHAEITRLSGREAADAWLASLPPYTDDRLFIRKSAFSLPFTAGTPGSPSEELRQAAREMSLIDDLRLIVLDTARRFTDLSLSNGTSANRFMKGMTWLASQLQCTVLAIGHPVSKGRNETGLPGDTLFGASDFVWRIQAGEDSTDDAPNAMIIAEKVKSGPLFPPVAYELERIQWQQPATDPETGLDIPGETVTVRSVTVRQREDDQAHGADGLTLYPPAERAPLPEAEPVPPSRPRRRTGIRPHLAFRPVVPAAAQPAPEPEPEPSEGEQAITGILTVPCPTCTIDPVGSDDRQCTNGLPFGLEGYDCGPDAAVTMHRGTKDYHVHPERLIAAVKAGEADPDVVLDLLQAGTAQDKQAATSAA